MSTRKKTVVLLKVLLLGESSVGKTSIFQRYAKDEFVEEYKATIGADFFSKDVTVDGREVILQMWDTAGQERYKSLGATFYRGSDACMVVYDVCDKSSFDALTDWVEQFLKGVGMETDDPTKSGSGLNLVVVGNKCDLTESREVDSEVAREFCNTHGYQFFETSAKTGLQVTEAFEHIVRKGVEINDVKKFSAGTVGINIDETEEFLNETSASGSGGCVC